MNLTPNSLNRRSRAGLTLVEILIATAIAVIVGSAAMWLLAEATVSSLRTSNISDNDLAQWGLNNRLLLDSRLANGARVYSAFDPAVINLEGNNGIPTGARGNFVALTSTTTDNITGKAFVTRIRGYVYDPNTSIISMFDYEVGAADRDDFRLHAFVLANRFAAISSLLKPIAHHAYVEEIDPAKNAFYRRSEDEVNLSFKMGDPKLKTRTRDGRLVEVSFFIRP